MTAIFGLCAIGIGVASVGGMQNLPAVVLAVIVGTLLGFVLRLGTSIQKLSQKMLQSMQISLAAERQKLLLTAVVLFCFSSSGMYGALDAGMTGSHSVLFAKSVLDFFTAVIFACSLGTVTALIGIPQAAILLLLYAVRTDCHSVYNAGNDYRFQSLRRFFTDGNRTSNDASQRISCGRYDSGHAACNADELSLEQFDVGDIQNIPLRSDSMPFHAASFFLKCVSIPAEKCLAQPE